jgi:hypothetical protein
MYLATWKEYTTSKLYKFRSVRRTAHKKLYLQRILTLDMEDKTFSIFGYEEGAGLSRTKVFDDIVGDLDALYI